MGVRIAVVGGGSTYTPELVDGFLARHDRLPVDELVLYDIDPERLEVVGGFADRMAEHAAVGTRVVATTNRDHALDGADFVVVQLRVGGQAARLIDETLPPTFGTIGQETTGAGGLAKALRTVPVVLELAEAVARRAPSAWIVDFTNPVGIVTQALLDEGHRAIGLCNVAIGFQRDLARRLDVAPERVELEHVGLNHLSWIRAVCVDGVDVLPRLLDEDAEGFARQVGSPVDLVRSMRAIPSYYLRYFYCFGEALAEQRAGHTRAAEVIDIERELLELYRDPELVTKPDLLAQRGGAFYSEAAAQLIASLHAGTGDVQVVDTRNDGALPDLPTVGGGGGAGADRPRWRDTPPPVAARTGPARAGPGGQGLRAAGDPGRALRRPGARATRDARPSARARLDRRRPAARRTPGRTRGPPAAIRALARRSSARALQRTRVERHVPVRLEKLEPALLLGPVQLLVREQASGDVGLAVRLHRRPVAVGDRHQDVPVGSAVAVESRGPHADVRESPSLQLVLEDRPVVPPEQLDELVVRAPLRHVEVQDLDGLGHG